MPGGLPSGGASRRPPRYPDVSAFTGGRPDSVDGAHPRTSTPPPLTRRGTAPERTEAARGASARREPAPRPSSVPRRPAPEAATTGSAASAMSGRVAAAAVAVGALATAGYSLGDLAVEPATTELAAGSLSLASTAAASGTSDEAAAGPRAGSGIDAATSGVLAVPASTGSAKSSTPVSSLAKGQKRAQEAVARAEAARAPQFVKPAQGRFTSGYGARWGSSHKGVDIAGPIGTPIVAVASGTVTAAGPASGFGQWVKVRLEDGTETVYGHVNRFFVSEGDEVKAGEEIAEIGNRGQSTGPHLHFEVHTPGGTKINPLPWLTERGISLGAQKD